MRPLVWNIVLAALWMGINASFTLGNFVFGFALGFVILLATRPVLGRTRYFAMLWKLPRFIAFMTWEIVLSSWAVTRAVLAPNLKIHPAMLKYPLRVKTDTEITLLANLITLTPGTLSVDVSDDKRFIYVHGLLVDDHEAVRASIRNGLELRIEELLR